MLAGTKESSMTKPIELSGRWEGFYTQYNQERPITAELTQEGDRLSGTMADGCTDIAMSISELAMEQGLPPGADEQLVESIRETFPSAPPGPIVTESHLPPDSIIEGDVHGQSVQFLKTYQGQHSAGLRIGETRMPLQIASQHQVQYHGQVSPDGQEIEGRWSILSGSDEDSTRVRSEGSFVLRRVIEEI
jgi:hypothetical protein